MREKEFHAGLGGASKQQVWNAPTLKLICKIYIYIYVYIALSSVTLSYNKRSWGTSRGRSEDSCVS